MQTTRGTPLTGGTGGNGDGGGEGHARVADTSDAGPSDAGRADGGEADAGGADGAAEAGTGAPERARGLARPRRRPRLLLLFALAATVLALDQATKALALTQLRGREPIELIGGVLSLRLVFNPGAAFGIGQGYTVVFTTVMIIVSLVIVRVARNLASAWWAAALGLLLGGAMGNLTDRLFRAPGPFRGHVIDFLELPSWPVFNLADSAIVCAGALMIGLTLRGVQLDGTRHPHRSDENAPGARTGDSASD